MTTHHGKYLGLLAIIVEYAAIVYFVAVTRQPIRFERVISDYGALSSIRLVFSLAFTLAGILFGLFGIWLSGELFLHRNVKITLLVAVIAQTILSWLPDQGSLKLGHLIAGIIVMIAMPVTVYYFSLASRNPLIRLLSRTVIWSEVLSIILLPVAIRLNIPLVAELIAGVSFQAWVVLATFEKEPGGTLATAQAD